MFLKKQRWFHIAYYLVFMTLGHTVSLSRTSRALWNLSTIIAHEHHLHDAISDATSYRDHCSTVPFKPFHHKHQFRRWVSRWYAHPQTHLYVSEHKVLKEAVKNCHPGQQLASTDFTIALPQFLRNCFELACHMDQETYSHQRENMSHWMVPAKSPT